MPPVTRPISKLLAPALPGSPEADPEGQGDQLQIEPEALPIDVDPVELELVLTRDIPRCVDLREAREVRPNAMLELIVRDLLDGDPGARSCRFDLLGQERARTDEAHVALEDVPELGQLVHRGGPEQSPDP